MFFLIASAITLGGLFGVAYGKYFFEEKKYLGSRKVASLYVSFYSLLKYFTIALLILSISRQGVFFTCVTALSFFVTFLWYVVKKIKMYNEN